MPAPSTEEYLHASQAIYQPDHPELVAQAGLRPFTDMSGKPLTKNDGGTIGAAYLDRDDNVVIAFQGTNKGRPLLASTESQVRADGQILDGLQPPEFDKARTFALQVLREAASQGFDQSRIFVTGHSLGGAEAEYAARTSGVGGESFGAPGQPNYDGARRAGAPSFTSHVAYGDPIANFASDGLERSIAGETAHHYGTVHPVGRRADQAGLARDVDAIRSASEALTYPSPDGGQGAATALYGAELHAMLSNLGHHSLDRSYAPALGIKPLPDPQVPRRQAELSPQDLWRAVAARGALAEAAGIEVAQSHGTGSLADPWRALAATGRATARAQDAGSATATMGRATPQDAAPAARSQRPGVRLG